MKAIVQSKYGSADVLELREVETPVPQANEVLVRVRAASMHPDIWHVVSGRPYVLRLMGAGLRTPKNRIPGTDVAGEVAAVGTGVTKFDVGVAVFGEIVPGYQWTNGGAFAEFVAVREDALLPKPANVTFEQAAAVPSSGLIALRSLRLGGLAAGQHVLINGAAGCVGSLALQIAKAYGARVTGVDHTSKLDLLRSLGADDVIDFTREDFTRSVARYDLVLDVASTSTLSACSRVLTPAGKYVLIGHDHFGKAAGAWLGSMPRVLKLVALSPFVAHLPKANFSMATGEYQSELRELLETGKLTPRIDRTFPLSRVREALSYMMEGRARGRIVINP